MSKKKSGSTMTLKDFHGGSIPSDLPLPSAPGVSVRPPDPTRGGSTWLLPGLGSGSAPPGTRPEPLHHHHHHHHQRNPRGSDPPFLPGFIGRHFDEDERKPFGSSDPPRRPLSDPAPRPAPAASRSDPLPKPQVQQRPRSGPGQNAWGTRKEAVLDPAPLLVLTGVAAKESLEQASAVEKISSGRWLTRQAAAPVPAAATVADVEVIAVEDVDRRFGESVRITEGTRARGYGGDIRNLDQERGRSRHVDVSEAWASEEKQFYQSPADPLHMENVHEMYGSKPVLRPGAAGADSGSRVIERPKLNIKPRSLPVEQSDETTERDRKTVFGGARPRELVLKERGIDSPIATTLEVTSTANRVKKDTSKTEMKSEPAAPITQRGERFESFPPEQRNIKNLERKEHRAELEKSEMTSWRNDNRRNTREIEKPVERREEPDKWRKSVVEQPKPEAPVLGPRHGKAASALELAQAFSRSTSGTQPDNRVPSQRSLPTKPQVPFSRLTDTREIHSGPSQRQINGY